MKYLRNVWYLAAWSHELEPGAALARTLLDVPVVLFRQPDGSPAALLDRCPHRFAPLSAGHLRGGEIVCRYHGLGFDGTGMCRTNPHGPIPKQLAVASFPLAEAHRAVWIWMGEREKADPARIPDLAYLSAAPESAFSCGYMVAKGHYEIFVDNLMDLSHTDYLHPDTLGGAGITSVRPDVAESDDHIDVTWFVANTRPAPALAAIFPELPEKTDVWQRVRWHAPGVMKLIAATVAAGRPESESLMNVNAHVLTPETATTSHYFYAATRNFAVEDAALNARIAAARDRIFRTEDKPMIEQIQSRMGDADFWSLNPVLLPVDAAPVRVRRRLQELIEAEG